MRVVTCSSRKKAEVEKQKIGKAGKVRKTEPATCQTKRYGTEWAFQAVDREGLGLIQRATSSSNMI